MNIMRKIIIIIYVFFLKEINLLIQVSNTIAINIEWKVLKTLKDDAKFELIAKMIDSRRTQDIDEMI